MVTPRWHDDLGEFKLAEGGDAYMMLVAGEDRDQDFLVVMTIQRGQAPAVAIAGEGAAARATVGQRSVSFDGQKLLMDPAK